MRPEALDALRSPAEREELYRLELVARHGGVAADLRLACRRRIDSVIAALDAFAAASGPGSPSAALVGAAAGHPALAAALAAAEPYGWHDYPDGTTGARALAAGLPHGLTLLSPGLVDPPGALRRLGALCVRDHGSELETLRSELAAVEARLRAATGAAAAPPAAP